MHNLLERLRFVKKVHLIYLVYVVHHTTHISKMYWLKNAILVTTVTYAAPALAFWPYFLLLPLLLIFTSFSNIVCLEKSYAGKYEYILISGIKIFKKKATEQSFKFNLIHMRHHVVQSKERCIVEKTMMMVVHFFYKQTFLCIYSTEETSSFKRLGGGGR